MKESKSAVFVANIQSWKGLSQMIKKEKEDKILSFVKSKGYASMEEISSFIDISPSTVRRYIMDMDKEGLLVRERGGASSIKTNAFPMVDQKLIVRERMEGESKLKIAKVALAMIEPNTTIYIDAGSSTLTLAKLLPSGMPITIVTDSLTIATVTSEKGINTYLIGGILKITTDATVGPMAEEELSKFHFNQAFMGANAVDEKYGFMTPDFSEASLKRKAVELSEKAIFLVDKTKFEKKSVVSFASLEGNIAITDFKDVEGKFSSLQIKEVS